MAPSICLDFDDTLCGPDEQPMPGTREVLAQLRANGASLIVSSARFSPMYGELNRFRLEKVEGWLASHGIEVDAIELFVPMADLYVDDRAHRIEGSWEAELPAILERVYPGWRKHRPGRPGGRGQVNISLDCVWSLQEKTVAPGAREALGEMARLELKVAISAGPFLDPDDPEAAPALPSLRQALKDGRLRFARIDGEKIAAAVYVNPRAYRFEGDWSSALPEIEELLARIGETGR